MAPGLNIVPSRQRTFTRVRNMHVVSQFIARVDFAAVRRDYARQDAQLGRVLTTAVKRLLAQVIPQQVRVNPKLLTEVKVPDAWRAQVQGQVAMILRQTWAAGAANARVELRKAQQGKFSVEDEPRDEHGRWSGVDAIAVMSDWKHPKSEIFITDNASAELMRAPAMNDAGTGSRTHSERWPARADAQDSIHGRYSGTHNAVLLAGGNGSYLYRNGRVIAAPVTSEVRTAISKAYPGARIMSEPNFALFALAPETLPEYIDTLAYNLTESLGTTVVDALRPIWANALANDWPAAQLVDTLTEALSGYVDMEGRDLTPARLATIVRTTNTNAFNQSRRDVFEDPALGGFVEAYEYSAVLDDRTTALCEYLDGRVYPVDDPFWDEFMPPNHFNCRSLAIPVVQGDEWTASAPPKESTQPQAGFTV